MEHPAKASASALLPNNFDLLRLLAALQVLVMHSIYVFQTGQGLGTDLLAQAPGVPVFFFISGFLISAAWERNPNLPDFARNRFLRLAPAYLAVTLFSLAAILAFAHLPLARVAPKLALWLGAQLVLLSDWNPGFLRGYGDGVVNGSLWTIPIEVCFYAATPFLYRLIARSKNEVRLLAALAAASFVLLYVDAILMHRLHSGKMIFKFIDLTPFPWFGMFICGLLAQRYRDVVLPVVRDRAWLFGLLALVVMAITVEWRLPPLLTSGNRTVGIVNFATLALFAMAFAYSGRGVAARLLHRNDISYGLYLFHLPIANALFANGFRGVTGILLTGVLAIGAGCLSWFLIEKPILARRGSALYRHETG
ncbi:MAG TPA: acyltransferase [Rhizomicrobium sp.]|jgi:peptidoglycan/LPS O-acetylase OafA/YrhL|nr:acyltransferase [Rhizomicrobium sp.]